MEEIDRSALLGSINHVLKTAFKELYPLDNPDGGHNTPLSQQSQDKISQIDHRLDGCRVQAEDLLSYLTAQHDKAKVKDVVEADRLKKEGILVRAHIPIGPSHLELDPQVLQSFGKLGAHLLSAHDLIEANHIAMLRRSGRMPVADEGIRKLDLKMLMYVEPHYYKPTSNLERRKRLALLKSYAPHGAKHIPGRDQNGAKAPLLHDQCEKAAVGEEEPQCERKGGQHANQHKQLGAGDQQHRALDEAVTRRMVATKVGFLKNPRYVKESRTYQSPRPLVFDEEYEAGQAYEATIAIRNVTGITRSFRLLPPTTKHFCIVSVTYPDGKRRDVAPGIAAKCRVRFIPDGLADYEDELLVSCESGDIRVPLMSRRSHPCLTWPDNFAVGECLIGDYINTSFEVVNKGGSGQFRLLTQDDEPSLLSMIHLPPFKVWPIEFRVSPGECLQFNVTYLPTSIGVHEARLLLLGDDCSKREVALRASCTTARLTVSEMEGVTMDYDALEHPDFNHMSFGAVPLGSSAHKSLTMLNNSSVSIGFEWKWLEEEDGPADTKPAHPPFLITPAAGRLDPQGTMRFDVEYSPSALKTEQAKAAFVMLQVPLTSVPLTGQADQLKELSEVGEHRLFRLQNWCRAVDGGAMKRHVLERELFGPLLYGPDRHRILEVLDVLYGIETSSHGEEEEEEEEEEAIVPIGRILSQLPLEVKHAIEDRLESMGTVSEEPMPKMDLQVTTFHLCGSGDLVELTLHPGPHHDLPRDLLPGKMYGFDVEVENSSAVPLEYLWSSPLPIADNNTNDLPPCRVSVEPSRATVRPGQRQRVRVEVVPSAPGWLALRLPCTITGFPSQTWPELTVSGHVVAPKVRFLEPEVDFGLLSVEGHVARTLSFVNETDVPLRWAMTQDYEGLMSEKISDGASLYALSSARSGTSNHSKGMTDEGGGGQSMVSGVIFEPSTGVLQPLERAVVTTTLQGGRVPERLRGRIACQVSSSTQDEQGDGSRMQYIGYRGEIQELKVCLDKLHLDLGITYVGVPVKRVITVTNISNLSTRFKFEKPVEGPSNTEVSIIPETGMLNEKEAVKVTVMFVAKAPGVVDDLYACRVFGMNHPIGFQVKSVVKGVVAAFEVLGDGQALPKPVAPPYEPQLPPGVIIPGAGGPPTLDFGVVRLFDRKRLRLIIRNLSPVPAEFRLRSRKYPSTKQPQSSIPPPPLFGTVRRQQLTGSTVSMTRTARSSRLSTTTSRRPVHHQSRVDDTHERLDRFKSQAGRDYLAHKYNREEDREILSAGNGLAVEVHPNAGLLVPWGVTEVAVTSYNNMPGQYCDELECAIVGAPTTALTAKIKVEGCPLSLRRECVGLDSRGDVPIVQFGEVCSRDGDDDGCRRSKTITVQNSGPLDAVLTWHILDSQPHSTNDRVPRVSVSIMPDDGDHEGSGRGDHHHVSVKVRPTEFKAHPVYAIEPVKQTVQGFSDQRFTVTMKTPVEVGDYAAKLIADAEWQYPRATAGTPKGAGTDRRTLRSAVRMLAQTKVVNPVLALDKRRHPDKAHSQYLKFEVSSRDVHGAHTSYLKGRGPLHPSMHRSFAVTNPLTVPLSFSVDVPEPFRLLDGHTSTTTARRMKTPGASSAAGRTFFLGPHESTNLDVAFIPPLPQPSTSKTTGPAQLKVDTERALAIQFSTGQIQHVHLRGIVLLPLLIAAPAEYSFGTVHVEGSSTFTLFISNPTLIEAVWRLVHVPSSSPRRARRGSIIPVWADREAMAMRDDESVFSFSERHGVMRGPSLPLKSSAACLPEDVNRMGCATFPRNPRHVSWRDKLSMEDKLCADNDDATYRSSRPIVVTFRPQLNVGYKSRFRFEVESGEGFDIVLSGYGTYDEDPVPAPPPHV